MSDFSSNQKKAMSAAGLRELSDGSWGNGSSKVKKDGDSTIFDHKRHNKYGAGISDTFFSDRLKK